MKKVFCVLLLSLTSYKSWAVCRVQLAVENNWKEGSVEVWAFRGVIEDELSPSFIKGAELARFQQDAKKTVGNTDPEYLIRRQKQIFEKAGFRSKVFDNVLIRASTHIGPIGCLEGSLFNFFGQRLGRPLFQAYSEMAAYILQAGSSSDYKVYVMVNPTTAMVPNSKNLDKLVRNDLSNGFRLRTHLHNHPFNPGGPRDDIAGTTIPSGDDRSAGDFSAYAIMVREFDLQEARITNGLHTLRIRTQELPRLLE